MVEVVALGDRTVMIGVGRERDSMEPERIDGELGIASATQMRLAAAFSRRRTSLKLRSQYICCQGDEDSLLGQKSWRSDILVFGDTRQANRLQFEVEGGRL